MKIAEIARRCGLGVALASCLGLAAQAQDQAPAAAFGRGRMVRGTVTATAPDHLTVKTEEGESFQVTVTPDTRIREGRDTIKLADIHAGDGVGAMGEVDRPNKTVHALMLMVVTAEQLKKAREAMGKSYIAGKVTAIDADNLKLTILRTDGVTQTIQVDDGTSFRRGGRGMQMGMGAGMASGGGEGRSREGAAGNNAAGAGGESITLADIKVGDMAGGPGALKNGVFIPTELSVGTPGARGQRRREGDAADAKPKPTPPPQQ